MDLDQQYTLLGLLEVLASSIERVDVCIVQVNVLHNIAEKSIAIDNKTPKKKNKIICQLLININNHTLIV